MLPWNRNCGKYFHGAESDLRSDQNTQQPKYTLTETHSKQNAQMINLIWFHIFLFRMHPNAPFLLILYMTYRWPVSWPNFAKISILNTSPISQTVNLNFNPTFFRYTCLSLWAVRQFVLWSPIFLTPKITPFCPHKPQHSNLTNIWQALTLLQTNLKRPQTFKFAFSFQQPGVIHSLFTHCANNEHAFDRCGEIIAGVCSFAPWKLKHNTCWNVDQTIQAKTAITMECVWQRALMWCYVWWRHTTLITPAKLQQYSNSIPTFQDAMPFEDDHLETPWIPMFTKRGDGQGNHASLSQFLFSQVPTRITELIHEKIKTWSAIENTNKANFNQCIVICIWELWTTLLTFLPVLLL